MSPKLEWLPSDMPSFAGCPRCQDLQSLDAEVAIIGIPYRSPYAVSTPLRGVGGGDVEAGAVAGPALRRQSQAYAHSLRHYDFDFEGDLFAGHELRIVDCGDLALVAEQHEASLQAVTDAARAILARRGVPIVLGGDHGTPIPVLQAYRGHDSLCVVQVDAHLDFRDERQGCKHGFSSPMRRAAELPWVGSLIQIGLRGVGSGRREEHEAACRCGSVLVRAQELHRFGVEHVLGKLPEAAGYYITIDADGLDPSIAPGVYYPSPGGVDYVEMTDLVKGIARRGPEATGLTGCPPRRPR